MHLRGLVLVTQPDVDAERPLQVVDLPGQVAEHRADDRQRHEQPRVGRLGAIALHQLKRAVEK